MTAYSQPPAGKAIALLPGVIGYSWGNFNNRTPDSRFSISNVALITNVVTLTVQLLEGLIPVVGALITVRGLQTASALNVTNIALASVSINLTTGAGTLTYALTNANIASTADSGLADVPQPVTQETLNSSATAGQQFAIQSGQGGNKQHGLTWFTNYAGGPTAVTANLQIADVDLDANYTTVDSSTKTTGETRSVGNVTANFTRVQISGSGGSSPTAAAGIMLS